MDAEIVETGSLEGTIARQRYSPDGLGVVKLLTGDGSYEYFLVLFEFKSPLRSIPDGKVPKYYMPQLQTGMLTIPMVETSIFVNNSYRKCSLDSLNFKMQYDHIFHDKDLTKKLTKAQKIETVYGCGMIFFYHTQKEYEQYLKFCGYADSDDENETAQTDPRVTDSAYDIDILLNSNEEPIDFGLAKFNIMDRLFELYEEGRVHVKYSPIIINPAAVNTLEFVQTHGLEQSEQKIYPKKILKDCYYKFLEECDSAEYAPIGYMPWKLIKTDIISVDRDDDWTQKISQPITSTLEIIDKIMSAPDREAAYFEQFPASNDKSLTAQEAADMLDDCAGMFKKDNDDETDVILDAI
jgi:hypothetical protein